MGKGEFWDGGILLPAAHLVAAGRALFGCELSVFSFLGVRQWAN